MIFIPSALASRIRFQGTHGLGLGDLLDAVASILKTFLKRSTMMKLFNFV